MHEPARQRARELANTPEFAKAQRQRKKVEALFAELKNQIGLRRLRLRRLKFVREQFFLAAAAQNIKRLVRFLSQAATVHPARDHLALVRSKNSAAADNEAKWTFPSRTFSTPTPVFVNRACHLEYEL